MREVCTRLQRVWKKRKRSVPVHSWTERRTRRFAPARKNLARNVTAGAEHWEDTEAGQEGIGKWERTGERGRVRSSERCENRLGDGRSRIEGDKRGNRTR